MEFGQFKQVHTSAGGRKSIVRTSILNTERRVQLFKAEQWRPRATGDKFEQVSLPGIVKLGHDSPKALDDRMGRRVAARVVRMLLQIFQVYRCVSTRHKHLEFPVTECLQPLEVDDIRQALEKFPVHYNNPIINNPRKSLPVEKHYIASGFAC